MGVIKYMYKDIYVFFFLLIFLSPAPKAISLFVGLCSVVVVGVGSVGF